MIEERYELAVERIRVMQSENTVPENPGSDSGGAGNAGGDSENQSDQVRRENE